VRYAATAFATLWIAGALQMAVAPRVPFGAPDFPLVALSALALLGERRSGTVIGFSAGLLRGVLAGTNLAVYGASRTVLGFALGWIRHAGLVPNAPTAGVSAFAGTILAQLVVMVVAHRAPVLPFLGGTLFSAMIDGALAMPLYALLRRLIDSPNDR